MQKAKTLFLLLVSILFVSTTAIAQENEEAQTTGDEELKSKIEAMEENVSTLNTDVSGLKKIKVSGYLQVQFDKTESSKGFGASPYNSSDMVKSRFRIRRSRLKFNYDAGLTQMVVQGDFSNEKFELKDAYLSITDPWTKYFTLTSGVFNRPTYEVEYSSSTRESMERSALTRALYPGERDLGAMLTINPNDWFKLQLAGFNNTYLGDLKQFYPNHSQEAFYFMGRLTKEFLFPNAGMGLDVGVHGRYGKVAPNGKTAYLFESDEAVPKKYNLWDNADAANESAHKKIEANASFNRGWFGLEAQYYWDFLGGMKLMGEYIMGSDVNELLGSDTLSVVNRTVSGTDTSFTYSKNNQYLRKRDFSGFYVMLVKNIGTDFQLAIKYDSYNPNTAISETNIKNTKELTVSTLGFGIHNYTFPNVRLSLWYDMINTKTNDNILKNDPIDNLLTVRLQYKF